LLVLFVCSSGKSSELSVVLCLKEEIFSPQKRRRRSNPTNHLLPSFSLFDKIIVLYKQKSWVFGFGVVGVVGVNCSLLLLL